MTRRLIPLALFAAFTLAAFGAIRSYDFFWQLATGRWIVEHRALPLTDPFAVASDRQEWIDGEWLYEVALHAAHAALGLRGLSLLKGVLAALIFTIAFLAARRESQWHAAMLLATLAFAGAMPTLDLRPSTVAALLVAVMLATRSPVAHGLCTVLWINVHPSALLAPAIAYAAPPSGRLGRRRLGAALVCAMALFINPHGWKAVLAPIQLTSFVRGGAFVNAEWLPSDPRLYPILYIALAIAVAAFVTTPNRERNRDWWRIALLAMFAVLAVRHVRNQPLFFAAFPILVAPDVRLERLRPVIAYAAAAIAIFIVALSADHRLGVPPERFPIASVARLRAAGLRGNIYNPDQFGGFLIWSFYPERRALTDGRNELYRTFIPEWMAARGDQRRWNALLRKYRIDIALEEYHPPIRAIDARTGTPTEMASSLAYWPRAQWALIAYDDAAMVFARRAAFPAEVIGRWEMRGVVPDARDRPRFE